MLRWHDWLDQGEEDLAAARTLAAAGHHAWGCFACQQAAEKALKALLDFHRSHQPGHNLLDLLDAAHNHAAVPPDFEDRCRRLSRHFRPTRDPEAHPSGVPARQYGAADARAALEDADAVVAHARAQLRPAP